MLVSIKNRTLSVLTFRASGRNISIQPGNVIKRINGAELDRTARRMIKRGAMVCFVPTPPPAPPAPTNSKIVVVSARSAGPDDSQEHESK